MELSTIILCRSKAKKMEQWQNYKIYKWVFSHWEHW